MVSNSIELKCGAFVSYSVEICEISVSNRSEQQMKMVWFNNTIKMMNQMDFEIKSDAGFQFAFRMVKNVLICLVDFDFEGICRRSNGHSA